MFIKMKQDVQSEAAAIEKRVFLIPEMKVMLNGAANP